MQRTILSTCLVVLLAGCGSATSPKAGHSSGGGAAKGKASDAELMTALEFMPAAERYLEVHYLKGVTKSSQCITAHVGHHDIRVLATLLRGLAQHEQAAYDKLGAVAGTCALGGTGASSAPKSISRNFVAFAHPIVRAVINGVDLGKITSASQIAPLLRPLGRLASTIRSDAPPDDPVDARRLYNAVTSLRKDLLREQHGYVINDNVVYGTASAAAARQLAVLSALAP